MYETSCQSRVNARYWMLGASESAVSCIRSLKTYGGAAMSQDLSERC